MLVGMHFSFKWTISITHMQMNMSSPWWPNWSLLSQESCRVGFGQNYPSFSHHTPSSKKFLHCHGFLINVRILPPALLTLLHGLPCILLIFTKISFSGYDDFSSSLGTFLKLHQGFDYHNHLIYNFYTTTLQLLSHPTRTLVYEIK